MSVETRNPAQDDDVMMDHEGPSLLEAREKGLKKDRGSITRTIIAASINIGERDEKAIHKELCDIVYGVESNASGLVILHESSILIFLETSSPGSTTIASKLQPFFSDSDVRILCSSDDIPKRLLEGVSFRKITLKKTTHIDIDPDDISTGIFNVCDVFLQLINHLSELSQGKEFEDALDQLSTEYQDYIPTNTSILCLASHKEIMSLNEFIELYHNAFNHDLESEFTWPMQ